MTVWFLLALGAAIVNSAVQATQKWLVSATRYSKVSIAFIVSLISALVLFLFSFFVIGLPAIDSRFWFAVAITGILNFVALPIMLKAYELGEFSSVYSMILMTPVFLLGTSFLFLGELPSWPGFVGVIFTIIGLIVVTRSSHLDHPANPLLRKGNWLGIIVALIWSVSINFDKLAAQYSDPFFSPVIILAMMSLGYATYLLIKHQALIVRVDGPTSAATTIPRLVIVGALLLGVAMALSNILHNAALLHGLASYTIAVKRLGVLFGVVWGWIFFKEKNIGKKVVGAALAVVGVIAIVLS